MNEPIAQEAAEIAIEELKLIRSNFNEETPPAERLKVANASIRIVQCLTRVPQEHAGPGEQDQEEPETRA